MALVKQDDGEDMIIKPEAVTPAIDTSAWPLLLRNWDQREYPLSLLEVNALTKRSTRPHRPLHTYSRRLYATTP